MPSQVITTRSQAPLTTTGAAAESTEISTLFQTVVNGGYCIGCGACAAVASSPIQIGLDSQGRYQAHLKDQSSGSDARVLSVCPFSGTGLDENQIGQALFGHVGKRHGEIGFHLGVYAGYVSEGDFRDRGSSGGMGTWILTELFKRNLVDGVLHVSETSPRGVDSPAFSYSISRSLTEIQKGAKSRYYPVEMSTVLDAVRTQPGRYAVIGVPCFIKAVRLLALEEPVLRERIVFSVSLVCGHLKSAGFAEMLGWQCGVVPRDLRSIDFRQKIAGQDANKYGVEVEGLQDGKLVRASRAAKDLFGSNWGYGFFKYKACDFCDDVMGETADLSIGDAWLPEYTRDSRGTNVLVTRHPVLDTLIRKAASEGRLKLDSITANRAAESQAGGFRHRRDGLQYRLALADREGTWRPGKRVSAKSSHLSRVQKELHRLRVTMAAKSHELFAVAVAANDFEVFREGMNPWVERYKVLSRRSRRRQPIRKLASRLRNGFRFRAGRWIKKFKSSQGIL
jgi:coenzyme F420-reducing hydrogenase beta subunit